MDPEKRDALASAGRSAPQEETPEGNALIVDGPSRSGPADGPAPAYHEATAPTVASPFSFPQDSDLPEYTPHAPAGNNTSETARLIAIPQLAPEPTAPFLSAYAPDLLAYGITPETWRSFLETMSAFLTATVSDRAVSHAAEMAKEYAETRKTLGKDIYKHSKQVGKTVAERAKRGNLVGALVGAVGGAVSITVVSTLGAAGAIVSLPFSAAGTLTRKPKTPIERAVAYAMVANEKWLHTRGLHVQMLTTPEMTQSFGVPVAEFLQPATASADKGAPAQLKALEKHIAPLEVQSSLDKLDLTSRTLWVAVFPLVYEEK